ncbi:MAG: hypothetical protein ACLUFV_02100 [Acutalibacteraceae bacterium]
MLYKQEEGKSRYEQSDHDEKNDTDDDGRDLLRIASDTLPDAGHKAIEAFYTKSDRDFQQSCESCCRAPNATARTSASSPSVRFGD